MGWIKYDQDKDATTLEGGSYLCRLNILMGESGIELNHFAFSVVQINVDTSQPTEASIK